MWLNPIAIALTLIGWLVFGHRSPMQIAASIAVITINVARFAIFLRL